MKVLIVDDDINTVDAIRRSLDWEKLEIGEDVITWRFTR